MDEIVVGNAERSEVKYASYTAFTQFTKCGKQYELKRIERIEDKPAWYFVGGDAFHLTAELYDLARVEAGNP